MIDLKLIEEKAISILTECDTAMLASVTEEGYPRPVPMGKIKADGISQIWFSTGTFSDKTIQFQLNPKAGVCFMKGGDSIVLTGKVEIVSDMEIKKALWSDWMFAHFPGGVIDLFTSETSLALIILPPHKSESINPPASYYEDHSSRSRR